MSPASMEKAMHPAGLKAGRSLLLTKRCQQMRTPGGEPGSQAWEACMMPLHYVRCHLSFCWFCCVDFASPANIAPTVGLDTTTTKLRALRSAG